MQHVEGIVGEDLRDAVTRAVALAANGHRDNFAGYIIGQALDGIDKIGCPHPILCSFAEQWRQKFGEA